jgi:hypothetical protein
MVFSIKEFLNDLNYNDVDDLAEISDRIMQMGTLKNIRKKTSLELFTVHISLQVIGIWQGDGWHSIIVDNPGLLPYVPHALEQLGLTEVKKEFEDLIKIFPEFTVFKEEDSILYCDIMNFFIDANFKLKDKRLNNFHKKIQLLDNLVEPMWGYGSPQRGWQCVV